MRGGLGALCCCRGPRTNPLPLNPGPKPPSPRHLVAIEAWGCCNAGDAWMPHNAVGNSRPPKGWGSLHVGAGGEGKEGKGVWPLTQHCQLGLAGAQRRLGGLALVQCIVGELRVRDLQVVLARVGRADDPVPWPR